MFVAFLFFGGALTSNDILYGIRSEFIFSRDQSAMSLLLLVNIFNLHMIGQLKMNERLHDMTPCRCKCIVKEKNIYNRHLILIYY